MTKILEIYTEKFLKKVPEENYLLHKPIEEWTDRDWVAFGDVTKSLLMLKKLDEEKKE
ncbi:hypothetical protein LCGC14_1918630 [marine sediment metagenome]|uniref:Uncharacterized protein n=1 Tax=marine sediment metagenome TaxID=412755 RepID=A0A0F9I5F8_9ZZZZ